MKKVFVSFAAVLALGILMTSCLGKSKEVATEVEGVSADSITVVDTTSVAPVAEASVLEVGK